MRGLFHPAHDFGKVLPLICLLFFKSFYEIIIATCLQQGKLVFCLSVPHFFCAIFCRLLLNTTTFGASQSCEQFVTNHFSFAASYFCRSMSAFKSSSLAALYSLYLKQLSAEQCACVWYLSFRI
ncbi:hypothetical protein MRX96_005539 [Rhipicephalus microplus]